MMLWRASITLATLSVAHSRATLFCSTFLTRALASWNESIYLNRINFESIQRILSYSPSMTARRTRLLHGLVEIIAIDSSANHADFLPEHIGHGMRFGMPARRGRPADPRKNPPNAEILHSNTKLGDN
jgi:hypothetical protein